MKNIKKDIRILRSFSDRGQPNQGGVDKEQDRDNAIAMLGKLIVAVETSQ